MYMNKLIYFGAEITQNEMWVDMMIFGRTIPTKHVKITSLDGMNSVYIPQVWWNYAIPGTLIKAMDEFLGIDSRALEWSS